MPILTRLMNTLGFGGGSRDAIAEELLFHLEEKTRSNMDDGMDHAAARENAMRSFGNRSVWGDAMRDVDVVQWLDNVRRDLFHAIRGLARRPGLAFTAIASLGLGIGATTALFSLADAVFLRPLPFPHPEQIVAIVESKKGEESVSNPVRMNDWATLVPALGAVGGYYAESLVLTGEGSPARLQVLRAFGRFEDVLGEKPVIGRLFGPEEQDVVVLSNQLWQGRYHGDMAVLGKVLHLNGVACTVIGVLPAGMRFPDAIDAIAPPGPRVKAASRKAGFLSIVGRRKPDAGLGQLTTQLSSVAQRLAKQYPATDHDRSVKAIPLQRQLGADARNPLLLLFIAAALVLLIACVNVASLLLSRAVERKKESAIRISLGAGRSALIRHYLAESMVLSIGGGLFGLLLGKLALSGLLYLMPVDFPLPTLPQYDWRAALFALGASFLSGMFFGWAPTWQASSGRLSENYRATISASGLWMRRALVGAQVALSVLLLVSVGLVAKSLYKTQRSPMGFQPDSVLTAQVSFGWETPESLLNEYSDRVLENLKQIPGVSAVGLVDRLPLKGGTQSGPILVRGVDLSEDLKERPVNERAIKGEYLSAAGIPLITGRGSLNLHETIVNETLVRRYFGGISPLGRQISTHGTHHFTIVGVAGDVRVEATQTAQPAEMFIRMEDTYWPLQSYVIRAMGDPVSLAGSVREAMRRADPNQIIDKVAPFNQVISESSSNQRSRVWLLGSFAGMALLLAAIGLYGVLASDVAQRKMEIGIRLALGAEPAGILSHTVSQGVLLAAAGLAVGLGGALTLARLVESFLYGVAPTDPLVFGAVALVLIVTAAAASWIPALRASRVDPAVTLRE
jgi:putative ABC transport system permease protein